jgi:ribosomal protein L22
MADRQGGKQSPGDAGTKQDQPSDQAGAEKAAVEAAEAKAAEGQEKAAEAAEATPKPKRAPRKKAEPKAEDTAAAETGVEKEAAEAAKPKRTRAKADAGAETEDKPKPRSRGSRGGRGRGAKEPAAEAAEAAKPEKPAPRRKRDEEALTGARPVVRAQAKYVRTSARKARLVCDHIRGKSVDEARAILAFTPRAVARDWSKLLESAVANAEHNHELVGDDLRVLAAFADEGPTLKRFRPRAMGRATRIRKRTSHLTIQLTPKE